MRRRATYIRKVWTDTERALLAAIYPLRATRQVAEKLERSLSSVYRMAEMLGLNKSETFLASDESGRARKGHPIQGGEAHRFVKGSVPVNKGVRMPGWGPGRMKQTQFKKGCRTGEAAKNWRPIGTILPDTEGYQRIKVREAVHGKEATGFGNTKVWPLLNRHVWEQHKGPIPPKHVVVFKDRNRANCAIENLELISMAENARRNNIWTRYPRELSLTIQAAGVLKRKIRSLSGKEQDKRSARPSI